MIKFVFKKITLPIVLVVLSIAAIYGSFLIWKITLTGEKINSGSKSSFSFVNTIKNLSPREKIELSGFEEGRINILLLGISGLQKGGANLSDTVIIASVNTKTNRVALLSIPRDLYVEIPDSSGAQAKINTFYQYGLGRYPKDQNKAIETVKTATEDITSLKIHYWAVLDFKGFIKIVDAIGGINITNARDIYDPRYPGPNYSYTTFELAKGFHHLDGETALKYARMRHNDPEGDFGRAKRQQQVIQAAKNKIFSARTFLNILALNGMLNALGDNLRTNISMDELGDFLELIKTADTNNINNVVIDAWNKDSLLIVSHVYRGDSRMFVLVPRIGSWKEVQEVSQNIFNMNDLKKRREEISTEGAKVAVINKSGNATVANRIENLLQENFGYKNTIILPSSAVNTEAITSIYDLSDGEKPYTLDELAKKMPAQISRDLPGQYKDLLANIAPDIVIVAGRDLVEKYSMEKGSFEEYNSSNE